MNNVNTVITITGYFLLAVGMITLLAGLALLIMKAFSRDVQEITGQAAKMAIKGLDNEISGTLGNASFLIKELNELIKTNRGIGMALVIIGGVLIGGGIALMKGILN